MSEKPKAEEALTDITNHVADLFTSGSWDDAARQLMRADEPIRAYITHLQAKARRAFEAGREGAYATHAGGRD